MKSEIIEVEAEETFEIAISNAATKEIARLDKFEKRIKELQDTYSSVVIKDAGDREGWEDTKAAIGEIRSVRVATDKERRDAKAPIIAAGKSIETKAQWIISELEKIEEPLIKQRDWYEAEKEKEKQAKIAREAAQLKVRVAQLTQMGATLDGISINLEHVSFDMDMIRSVHEEIYTTKIFPKFKEVFDAKEEIRIANKKAQDLIDEQNRKAAEELKIAQQKVIDDQKKIEDENKRIAAEKSKALKERGQKRIQQLIDLGMNYDFKTGLFSLKSVMVASGEIDNEPEDKWEQIISDLVPNIEIVKKGIQAEKEAEQKRLNQEAIDKAERERLQREEDKRRQEREELESGRDSERWGFFLRELNKLEIPKMKHTRWQRVEADAKNLINQIRSLKPNNK